MVILDRCLGEGERSTHLHRRPPSEDSPGFRRRQEMDVQVGRHVESSGLHRGADREPARRIRQDRQHPAVHEALEVQVALLHRHRDGDLPGSSRRPPRSPPTCGTPSRRAGLGARAAGPPRPSLETSGSVVSHGVCVAHRLTEPRSARRIRAVGSFGPVETQKGGSMPRWLRTLVVPSGRARARRGGLWRRHDAAGRRRGRRHAGVQRRHQGRGRLRHRRDRRQVVQRRRERRSPGSHRRGARLRGEHRLARAGRDGIEP